MRAVADLIVKLHYVVSPQMPEAAELEFGDCNLSHACNCIESCAWGGKEKCPGERIAGCGRSLALVNKRGVTITKNWMEPHNSFALIDLMRFIKACNSPAERSAGKTEKIQQSTTFAIAEHRKRTPALVHRALETPTVACKAAAPDQARPSWDAANQNKSPTTQR